MDDIRSA